MSGRFRLLALDIDGTLLRSDKALSPRTRAAVDEARAAGVRLVLATGRRYPSARKVAADLGGAVPLVLHNGALVVEADEVVRVRPLPRAAARQAVLAGRELGLQPLVHGGLRGEGYLVVQEAERSSRLVAYYLDRNGPDVRVVADILEALHGFAPSRSCSADLARRWTRRWVLCRPSSARRRGSSAPSTRTTTSSCST